MEPCSECGAPMKVRLQSFEKRFEGGGSVLLHIPFIECTKCDHSIVEITAICEGLHLLADEMLTLGQTVEDRE